MNWNTSFEAAPAQQPAAILNDPIPETMKAQLRLERLPETPDGILMLWERKKKALAELKDEEMEIRKVAVKVYVPNGHEGVNNISLGSDYTLKATISYNYKLDADNSKIEKALDNISALGNEGTFIAERLIGWTPKLSLSEYRKLQDEASTSELKKKMFNIINSVITITEAAPTLEIKAPKK